MFDYLDNLALAPTNYTGAAIFWLYIVAALFLTTLILKTLFYSSSSRSKDARSPLALVILFSVCAFVSFAVLSYNMLSVLVKSYVDWAIEYHIPHPSSISGPHGLIGPERQEVYLWQWSITSTLFNDFAEAIISNPSRYLWTKAELLATDCLACWMGIEGRMRQTPNLWAYFLLLEILPTSFTLNLFYLALLMHPSRDARMVQSVPMQWQILGGCYFVLFYFLPNASGTDLLIPGVLLLRVMLLLPLFLPLDTVLEGEEGVKDDKEKTAGGLWDRYSDSITMLAAAALPVFVVVRSIDVGEFIQALNSHPAVSTLGHDVLLCLGSWALWKVSTKWTQNR